MRRGGGDTPHCLPCLGPFAQRPSNLSIAQPKPHQRDKQVVPRPQPSSHNSPLIHRFPSLPQEDRPLYTASQVSPIPMRATPAAGLLSSSSLPTYKADTPHHRHHHRPCAAAIWGRRWRSTQGTWTRTPRTSSPWPRGRCVRRVGGGVVCGGGRGWCSSTASTYGVIHVWCYSCVSQIKQTGDGGGRGAVRPAGRRRGPAAAAGGGARPPRPGARVRGVCTLLYVCARLCVCVPHPPPPAHPCRSITTHPPRYGLLQAVRQEAKARGAKQLLAHAPLAAPAVAPAVGTGRGDGGR